MRGQTERADTQLMHLEAHIADERVPAPSFKGADCTAELTRGRAKIGQEALAPKTQKVHRRKATPDWRRSDGRLYGVGLRWSRRLRNLRHLGCHKRRRIEIRFGIVLSFIHF